MPGPDFSLGGNLEEALHLNGSDSATADSRYETSGGSLSVLTTNRPFFAAELRSLSDQSHTPVVNHLAAISKSFR